MARNIMHDHRVSVEREKAFDSHTNRPRTDSDLRDAIIRYKEVYIRTSADPQFLDAGVNGLNLVSGASGGRQIIHKDAKLVRVLDLNGLTPVFQWAKRKGHATFTSFPTRPSGYNVGRWLDRMIRQLPREQFVQACLDAMNDYSLHLPFHPTWAAAWQKFKPFAQQGSDRWLQVMGMPRPSGGRWLILLCYTVRSAGTVARPTQLDVGWVPQHFPSPPQARLRRGGHPIDLNTAGLPAELLSEFIHQQINHSMKHWRDAGEMLERTSAPTSEDLNVQRINHHRHLASRYGQDVFYWMPKCF
jgi:hypothetical protein